MTATTPDASGAPALPEYVPVPSTALGPGLNEQRYHAADVAAFTYTTTYTQAA
jgi:hypothetical protein